MADPVGWIRLRTPDEALTGKKGLVLPYGGVAWTVDEVLRWYDEQTLHPMYRMALAELGRVPDWFASG